MFHRIFLLATFIISTIFSTISASSSVASVKLRPFFDKAVTGADTLGWQPGQSGANYRSMPDPLIPDTAPTLYLKDSNELPAGKYAPLVYGSYSFSDEVPLFSRTPDRGRFAKAYAWLDDYSRSERLLKAMQHRFMMSEPLSVYFNASDMPSVPTEYRAYVDQVNTRIRFQEIKVDDKAKPIAANIKPKHWLHTFDGSLQFSQAYISPNWYQGGKNNLNMIGQLLYNVKLNQKVHPNLLFDTSISYKLALNSAPEDSIHAVNISEDIFQINSTFGLKAAKKWYYSANLLFKTQMLKSFPTNSRDVKSAFLSPGELNLGLGMTYSTHNKKKTATFGTSISPLSWNLKTCTDSRVDPTLYGLDAGRHTKNKVGSSAECTLEWKMAYNIVYHSRLFLFTDYDYAYGDWEHTFDFNINRFLSTRLYIHMRYDTSTPHIEDTKWSKFQLKEIFSFGFAYHFGSI